MNITYRRTPGHYLVKDVTENGYTRSFWAEIDYYPIIGEKYMVVYYCDYDNSYYI